MKKQGFKKQDLNFYKTEGDLKFYKTIKNNDDLVDYCIKEGTCFWQYLFCYLAFKKDENRLTQYVKSYGDIFKGDERR